VTILRKDCYGAAREVEKRGAGSSVATKEWVRIEVTSERRGSQYKPGPRGVSV